MKEAGLNIPRLSDKSELFTTDELFVSSAKLLNLFLDVKLETSNKQINFKLI